MASKTAVRFLPVALILFIFSQVAMTQTVASRGNQKQAALPIAVSGHEERLATAIRERLKALAPKTDNMGNVYVTIGSGAPNKLIAVAMDEPGYVVSGITDDGYLRVQRLPQAAVTPVFDALNFAQPVWIFTRAGKQVNGVFAGLSVHLQPGRLNGPKMNHPDELFVDVGARNISEVHAAGIDVLDAVATQSNLLSVGSDDIAGQSAASRIALRAALALIENATPQELKGTLTIAFVAQNWTGGRGMNRLLTELHPDEMILSGHFAPRAATNEKDHGPLPMQKLGSGILVGVPDASTGSEQNFEQELKKLAEAKAIPVTLLPANLPRIVAYVSGAEYPKRTIQIGIPALWAETPAETVNKQDAANLLKI